MLNDQGIEFMFHESNDTPAFKKFEKIKEFMKDGGNFVCSRCGTVALPANVDQGCFICHNCGNKSCGD